MNPPMSAGEVAPGHVQVHDLARLVIGLGVNVDQIHREDALASRRS